MRKITRKICSGIFVAILLAMGIACGGGGGGSSAVVLPTLPEGTLHIYNEGLGGRGSDVDYIEVTPALDEVPEGEMWQFGSDLWNTCYGEDGFIFVVEPDDPEADIARLSVALHNRGLNWTQDTLDFINADPANRFLVLDIMSGLIGEPGSGEGGNRIEGEVYITAGGYYQSEMKEGAQEMVDNYYSQLTSVSPLIGLFITKEDFQGYLSQQIYNSAYVGGERVTFAELADMFLNPLNWERLDFKITTDEVRALSAMDDITAASGRNYRTDNLSEGRRLYGGRDTAVNYTVVDFPEALKGRETIRTRLEDAGYADASFLTFKVTRTSTLYFAVDPANTGLITWLTGNGWTLWEGNTITAQKAVEPYTQAVFNLYYREYGESEVYPVAITLPGNGDAARLMYFVIAQAGTYPYGMEIIVSAHTALIEDNPADVASYAPGIKTEGGIVVNDNGIEVGGDSQTGLNLVHVDFTEEFDANVFVNTEAGRDDELQKAVGDVTDIEFVAHVLGNNGFRLIDTYNDQHPAFGGDSQVLQVETLLGLSISSLGYSIRTPLLKEALFTFANMNLLNSPNLIGVYLKSITTDDVNITPLWKEAADDKGLDVGKIEDYLELNAATVSYAYFLSDTNEEITLVDLLKMIGNREEGELTFRILITLPAGTCEIAAGAFIQDYFTNIYDPVIGDASPL